MDTPSEYSVTIRLIRQQHSDNIRCVVRLIDGYTESIFNQCPADPTVALRQYWIFCQADRWVHPSEYSVTVRLIRLQHPDNIGCAVRLIDGYTESIFNQYLADPTATRRQYSMRCKADQCLIEQIST